MYAIIEIVSIQCTLAGCYFEDHPLRLVEINLQLLLEETNSYMLSYWSTILGTNSPRAGPAAAMVDVLWSKKGILYKNKSSTRGSIFKEAQHLHISSFVDGLWIYAVNRKQTCHNH